MKKTILALIMLSTLSVADTFTAHQKETLRTAINITGYKCKKVDSASQSAWDGSITVYCDGFTSEFEIKKLGGNWTIKALR